MTGQGPDPEVVARQALAKAAAFDRLSVALGREVGLEWTSAMDPEWVVSMLLSKVHNRLELATEHEQSRKPWLRRRGW